MSNIVFEFCYNCNHRHNPYWHCVRCGCRSYMSLQDKIKLEKGENMSDKSVLIDAYCTVAMIRYGVRDNLCILTTNGMVTFSGEDIKLVSSEGFEQELVAKEIEDSLKDEVFKQLVKDSIEEQRNRMNELHEELLAIRQQIRWKG